MSAPRSASHSRRGRTPVAGVVGVLLAVVAAGGLVVRGLQQRLGARAAFPQAHGELVVAGIEAPVAIFRDRTGVPHIEAETEQDAFYGLGFVHAQDRLGQMLWLARTARGRTAELVGPEGVPADRLARLLDLGGLAEAAFARLDPDARQLLLAYARGVNARIERIRRGEVARPLALAGAEIPLDAWDPADSLAVLKLYAWGLSGTLDVSLVLHDLVEQLGNFGARRFFPQEPDQGPAPDATPRRLAAQARPPGIRGGLVGLVPDPLRRAARLEGRAVGSSAWVVSGAHTQSGLPILAADAHLEPTAPPLYHVDHVRGGAIDVAGATIPGLPVIWTGMNRRVAWASTHARAVTTDVYVEKLHPDDPRRYHDGKGWRALGERVERIRVRGGEEEVLTVRSTRHGPLVEALLEGPREPLSLAWAGSELDGGDTFGAFLAVARARDAAEVVGALARHHEPPLAVVYADAEGAMGMQVSGWIPRRPFATGLVPLPGRARWYQWRGPIDFEQLPSARASSDRGWIVAADNRLARGETEHIEWLWRTGERARRIDELLRAAVRRGALGLRRVAELQSDVGSVRARELVTRALALVEEDAGLGAEAREVADLLRGWDGRATARSVGAATYHVFLELLTEKLFARHLGEELLARYVSLPQVDTGHVVFDILGATGDAHDPSWTDPAELRRVVRESLRETWFRVSFRLGPNRSRWHWGRLHALRFHLFGPALLGQRGAPSGLGPFPYGGNSSTINAAEYAPGGSFDVRVASTWRFATDTAALDEALIALAPGQSEHPRHPHYTGGLQRWLEGRPTLLATSHLLVEEASAARLSLVPAAVAP